MQKLNITVAAPAGKDPVVLHCGYDADEAIRIFEEAKGSVDGEVVFIRKPVATRRWKGAATVKAAPTKRPYTRRSKVLTDD